MTRDELDDYLRSLEAAKCLRTEKVLKQSACETTEIVSFIGSNGFALGPLVRKTTVPDAQIGNAYTILRDAWRDGQRFKHLPRVFDCYNADEGTVVIMEYVVGRTLDDVISQHGASLELAYKIAGALCEAASELHESISPPLIHRDLKPSNIIVNKQNLTLIDFGIARQYRIGASRDTAHFGTREYAPPEQFGFGQTDERSDVYAIGMILYFCITGRPPHANLSIEGFPGVADYPEVMNVLARATSFDPARRYASARDLAHAFASAASRNSSGHSLESDISRSQTDLLAMDQDTRSAAARQLGSTTPIPVEAPAARPALEALECPSTAGEEKKARRRARLGLIRNACVLAIYLAGVIIALASALSPDSLHASYPLAARLIAYGGLYIVGNGGVAYLLLDKRRIRKRFPPLERIAGRREIAICILLIIIGAFSTLALDESTS